MNVKPIPDLEAGYTSFATGTGIFAIYFMISSITLAIPVISEAYHLQPVVSGFVIQSHLLGAVLFLLPAAKLGDIIGHGKILALGGLIFGFSSLICSFFPPGVEIWGLIAFRFIQGTGDAMIMASSLVLLSRNWNPDHRGESFGIFLFAGYMGYMAGLLGGGWMIDEFGWRAPFLFTVPLTMITGIAGYNLSLKDKSRRKADKFDLKGILLFWPAIFLIVTGLSLIPSQESMLLLSAGILLFVLFIFHERKSEFPLFRISLLKSNRIFSLALLSDLLYYTTIGAIAYSITIYLESVRGFGTFEAAIIILPISLLQGLVSPFTGRFSDRIDPKYISAAGACIIFVILIAYSQIDQSTGIGIIVIYSAVTGIGYALFSAPNKNAIMSSIDTKDQGNASGISNTIEQTGNLASIGIASAVFSLIAGGAASGFQNTESIQSGIDLVFFILGITCLVNIFILLARGRLQKKFFDST